MHRPRMYEVAFLLCLLGNAALLVWASLKLWSVGHFTAQAGAAFVGGLAFSLAVAWCWARMGKGREGLGIEVLLRPPHSAGVPCTLAQSRVTLLLGVAMWVALVLLHPYRECFYAFIAGMLLGTIPMYPETWARWRRAWELYHEGQNRPPQSTPAG